MSITLISVIVQLDSVFKMKMVFMDVTVVDFSGKLKRTFSAILYLVSLHVKRLDHGYL